MKDETKSRIAILIALIAASAVICFIMYAIWQESTNPKMELNKSEWECVKTETRMIPMLVGKVVVPQPRQECVEYKRN